MEKALQFARRQNTVKRHPIFGRCAQEYDEEYSDDELEPADHEDDLAELPNNGAKYRVATSKSDTSPAETKKLPREPAEQAVPEYDWPATAWSELDRYDTSRSGKGHVPPDFTYFNNQVFERVFPRLGERPGKRETEAFYSFPPRQVVPRMNKPHLQIVYAAVYSACFHKIRKMVKLSDMDVSRRTGIDWRTVQHDLFWLQQSGDIEMVIEGRSKARRSSKKALWSVPLAKFDMKEQHFTPVPKFVVDHYVPAYPRAILLPVLQYVRQWRKYNGYWVERARDATGWPTRTIYRALEVLGDERRWRGKNDNDPDEMYPMPRPIEVREQRLKLRYLAFKGFHERETHLVPEFAEHFGIQLDRRYRSY
jgi:hypothetical protein